MAATAARRPCRLDAVKVLVITNMYPPQSLGGYELSCRDVVRRWRAHGHEITILTTSTRLRRVDLAADPPEAEVHRELDWYWSDHRLVRPGASRRLHLERANRRRLDRLLDTTPDVVSVWGMGAMSMSLVSRCVERGVPMALVVEDDWLVYGPRIDAWTDAWSRRPRWLAALTERITGLQTRPPSLPARVNVLFASHYLLQQAHAEAQIEFSNSAVVPLGVDSTDFPIREPTAGQWQGRLLCVGRIEPRKGFDIAIRALVELPGASLRIVGPADDAHQEALVGLASSLGLTDRVSFDSVAREQLAGIYRDADVLIFPSRWNEPFGLVPLEAMTQATPVVATRRGGAAEFLADGENCIEVPINDPDAVAAAVRRLAADPALREQLVRAGLETAVRYDVDRFADDLEAHHLQAAGVGG